MNDILFSNPFLIGAGVIILLVAFLLGRASKKQMKPAECLLTEAAVREVAMAQLSEIFYRKDITDEEFGRRAEKIRATYLPVANSLLKQKT